MQRANTCWPHVQLNVYLHCTLFGRERERERGRQRGKKNLHFLSIWTRSNWHADASHQKRLKKKKHNTWSQLLKLCVQTRCVCAQCEITKTPKCSQHIVLHKFFTCFICWCINQLSETWNKRAWLQLSCHMWTQEADTNSSQVAVLEGHMSWQLTRGREEAGYWRHNAPERPDACLPDKHFGQRKNQVSAGCAFEVCWYCFFFFLQIKETGAFVVEGWRNVRKEAAILCHYILFHIGSHWKKKARTVFTGKGKSFHYLLVLCYLEVVEVKKTNGLWWNGATLKP